MAMAGVGGGFLLRGHHTPWSPRVRKLATPKFPPKGPSDGDSSKPVAGHLILGRVEKA